jgi:hypothetical protein
MRAAVLFAALGCSCVDTRGTATADLAAVDGSAPETVACTQSLADYCSQNECVADLTTAETSTAWCGHMGTRFADYTACDGYVIVWASGTDSGAGYVYDSATGALVAILWYANTQGGCVAGPMSLEIQGCRGETRICPTSP